MRQSPLRHDSERSQALRHDIHRDKRCRQAHPPGADHRGDRYSRGRGDRATRVLDLVRLDGIAVVTATELAALGQTCPDLK